MANAATKKASHLRVVEGRHRLDDDGEVYVPSHELVKLQEQYENLQGAHAKELANVKRLKRQIAELQLAEAEGVLINDVLAHWARVTGHPKAQIPLTGARAAQVRKRLREMVGPVRGEVSLEERQAAAVATLKRTAEGAARFPFEKYGERFCEAGKKAEGRKRKDDAVFIYANEKRVEDLAALAGGDNGHDAYARWLHGECKRYPVIVRGLALLAQREPHGEVLARCVAWAGQTKARRLDRRAAVLRSRVTT